MSRLQWLIGAVVVLSWGCGADAPLAPAAQQPIVESALLSGWVYARAESEDPALASALIEVVEGDGTASRVLTNDGGYYEVAIRPGTVSVTASKEGYEAKTWELGLLKDTVLNFGLAPK